MSSHKHPLGTVAELGEEAVGGLSKALSGELILPDHSEYNDARDVWNGLVNRYPAVVVRATGGQDVATAVSFAREHGLDLSVRGGAHQQAGDAVVDNFSAGGIASPIDISTGRLGPAVTSVPREGRFEMDRHPDTGYLLAGSALPEWDCLADVVMGVHSRFQSIFVG